MSELVFYPMRRSLKGGFVLLPEFLQRIEKFEDSDWCSRLAERFEDSFCKDNDLMLGVALMDGGRMRGHLIAGVEALLGTATVLVYQYAKDQGFDDDASKTNRELERMLEAWAVSIMANKKINMTHISILCKDEPRERLFGFFGYEKGPRLMRKEIGNGMGQAKHIQHES